MQTILTVSQFAPFLYIMKEMQDNKYWFYVNISTSELSAILFVFAAFLITRLRISPRLRQKMKIFLPSSWFEKKNTLWYRRLLKKRRMTPYQVQVQQPISWPQATPDCSRQQPICQPMVHHIKEILSINPGQLKAKYLATTRKTTTGHPCHFFLGG